ncbi:MAG: DUF305 domain-containing protein [Clostridiales bacterium]|nr:DUF305 domain-containing protein [Clostridiales bacterium]
MNSLYKLTADAKEYLSRYYDILEEMISGMTDALLAESISRNFIVQMIPHHMAAIEMSENILKYTSLRPLIKIAEGIISEQTESIDNMLKAKPQCGRLFNTPYDLSLYMKRFSFIADAMFSEMGSAYADNNISADFMREMIPHHRGAVRMCENALAFDICPELKPIMYKIISSQNEGITEMEVLLSKII